MRRLFAAVLALALVGAAPPPAPVARDVLMSDTPAAELSAYRLFTDPGARRPNAGVTPYALNTPLFSDYALKQRYLYLPPGVKAGYRPSGVLDLPVGATLVKTFAYPADFRRPDEKVRFVETRLLIHRKSGWVALAYVWNEEQTEAVLKRAGKRLGVDFLDAGGRPRHVDYAVPNANQCKECHSVGEDLTPIGPKARNLNGDYAYPEGRENQLAHWTRTGLLAGAPAPAAAPRTAVWNDAREPLEARARAYLDGNCGHCHNAHGAASNSGLFLDLEETRAPVIGVGKRPVAAGKGSGGLLFDIAPGDPDGSILVHRMGSTEPGVMMPELGRSTVHDEGLALVRAYVASLKAK
ncbi:SO2930 family diheme c-type cytochrome [Phenylobacterium soli]|uniref:Cytochrome c domain-containing protein n=1 Tax=Phenylobacterium soli TaxID=2170551 RepID=A0A328AH58_9CAUL|nr:SO2930 family diheme c-type cytochrome [Phenylobacterium soli]RAK53847.1 hypothetical protein DJ017_04555 [Phenylobacterium soli]